MKYANRAQKSKFRIGMLKKPMIIMMSLVLIFGIVFTTELSQFSIKSQAYSANGRPAVRETVGRVTDPKQFAVPFGKDEGFTNNQYVPAPEAYDLRDYGRVTPVRDQNPYGTCWAFAAVNSCESNLLTNGYANASTLDLSEKHLAYFSYNDAVDELGNTDGDEVALLEGENYLNNGGNQYYTKAVLSGWVGLVNESVMPYNNSWDEDDVNAEINASYPATLAYSSNSYHVKEVYMIPVADEMQMKDMIMRYGSGVVSMFWDDSCYDYTTGGFYNDVYDMTNHDVSVVGWDDNFSKDNFPTTPSRDGAWLIKNSWGDSWGDEGYFWMSYDCLEFSGYCMNESDAHICGDGYCEYYSNSAYFYTAEPVANDNNLYMYDGAGSVSLYSISDSEYAANVFTAAESEYISEITIGAEYGDYDVYVQIYKNVSGTTDPTNGTAVYASPVCYHVSKPGVANLPLTVPVSVSAGEKFSVVLSFSESIDMACDSDASWGWLDFYSQTSAGQSFNYYNNQWVDLSGSDTTLMIRCTTVKNYVPTTGISLNARSINLVVGETYQLAATVTPSNTTDQIIWSSSDEDSVIVSDDGTITACDTGVFTVTAQSGNYSASCTVNVTAPATSIELNRYSKTMVIGDTCQLVATVLPLNNTDNLTVSWSSSDTSVATVSSSGLVTAKANGSANIVATAGSFTATCSITVGDYVAVKSVTLSYDETSLMVGDTANPTVSVSPANASYAEEVTWTSNNTDVAVVAEDGTVTAVGVGTATINAIVDGVTSNGVSIKVLSEYDYYCSIATPLTSGKKYAVELNSEEGTSKWFKYTASPARDIQFYSSDSYNDPLLKVYNSNFEQIGYSDDSTNFEFDYSTRIEAGETYLFEATTWSGAYDEYTVTFYARLAIDSAELLTTTDARGYFGNVIMTYVDTNDYESPFWYGMATNDIDLNGRQVKVTYCNGAEEIYTVTDGKIAGRPATVFVYDGGDSFWENETKEVTDWIYDEYESDEYTYYSFENFLTAGTHEAYLAIGNSAIAEGAIKLNISGRSLAGGTFNNVDTQDYTGEAITPVFEGTLLMESKETDYDYYTEIESTYMVLDEDNGSFTTAYSNNVDFGTATATLTGTNGFIGKVVKTFNIDYQITNLRPISKTYNSITMQWSAVPGADGYAIYRQYEDSSWAYLKTVSGENTTTFTDTGLNCGYTYRYYVRPINVYNGSTFYGYRSNVNGSMLVPAAPVLSAEAISKCRIKLTWTPSEGASGYSIYKFNESTGAYVLYKAMAVPATSFADTAVEGDKDYTYMIRAWTTVNGTNKYGPNSNEVTACVPVKAPTSARAYADGYNIKITWQGDVKASSFVVFRKGPNDTSFRSIATVSGVSYYIDEAVAPGRAYSYLVKAKYGTVMSPSSNGTSNKSALDAVTGFTITKSGTSATLKWNAVNGATGYAIFEYDPATKTYNEVASVDGVTNYKLTNLSSGVHFYSIRAYREMDGLKGYSPFCDRKSVTI